MSLPLLAGTYLVSVAPSASNSSFETLGHDLVAALERIQPSPGGPHR